MKVINAAKGPNVKNYFYDAERDVFDTVDPRQGGWMGDFDVWPTHHIIVDDSYTAQQLDKLFHELGLFNQDKGEAA